MPIRINLLAEAQAAEDFRRRDPVKRALWMGAVLIASILAWASVLQARIALQKSQVSRLETKIKDIEEKHKEVVSSQKLLTETRQKLAAIEQLKTNRYLTGNLLDALQRAYVDDVRMVKLKTEFAYTMAAATPPKTNAFNVIPGTPATATERIKVQIEAVDASANPGDLVSKYKEAIATLPQIEERFNGQSSEVRLTGLNPPVQDFNGRQYVAFTLECAFPETVR